MEVKQNRVTIGFRFKTVILVLGKERE